MRILIDFLHGHITSRDLAVSHTGFAAALMGLRTTPDAWTNGGLECVEFFGDLYGMVEEGRQCQNGTTSPSKPLRLYLNMDRTMYDKMSILHDPLLNLKYTGSTDHSMRAADMYVLNYNHLGQTITAELAPRRQYKHLDKKAFQREHSDHLSLLPKHHHATWAPRPRLAETTLWYLFLINRSWKAKSS